MRHWFAKFTPGLRRPQNNSSSDFWPYLLEIPFALVFDAIEYRLRYNYNIPIATDLQLSLCIPPLLLSDYIV